MRTVGLGGHAATRTGNYLLIVGLIVAYSSLFVLQLVADLFSAIVANLLTLIVNRNISMLALGFFYHCTYSCLFSICKNYVGTFCKSYYRTVVISRNSAKHNSEACIYAFDISGHNSIEYCLCLVYLKTVAVTGSGVHHNGTGNCSDYILFIVGSQAGDLACNRIVIILGSNSVRTYVVNLVPSVTSVNGKYKLLNTARNVCPLTCNETVLCYVGGLIAKVNGSNAVLLNNGRLNCTVIVACGENNDSSCIDYVLIGTIGTGLVFFCFSTYPRVSAILVRAIFLYLSTAIGTITHLLIGFGVIRYAYVFVSAICSFNYNSALGTFFNKRAISALACYEIICRGMHRLVGKLGSADRADSLAVYIADSRAVLDFVGKLDAAH